MMDLIYSMYQGALFDSFEIIATLTKKPKILNLPKRFFWKFEIDDCFKSLLSFKNIDIWKQ